MARVPKGNEEKTVRNTKRKRIKGRSRNTHHQKVYGFELMQKSWSGIPIEEVSDVGAVLGFSQEQTSTLIGVSSKTFRAYLDKGELIQDNDADLILSIQNMISEGMDTFKDEEKLRTWLNMEWESLDFKKPVDFLKTVTGVQFITDELIRIRHGIFA